jgi:quinol monooxygenase YgiN
MRAASTLTTVVITCQIQPGKVDLARQEFTSIIETVVANEAACHGIDLHVDPDDSNRLLLIEYWDSKDAYTGPHMQTAHMQAFLQRGQAFIAAEPQITFWRVLAAAP